MSPKQRIRKSRPITPFILITVGALLILAAVIYLANPLGSSPEAPAAADTSANIPYPDIPRVSLADAKAAFDTGQAVFVDVRGEPFYSSSHIPGALSITQEELPSRLDELMAAEWIITYCT